MVRKVFRKTPENTLEPLTSGSTKPSLYPGLRKTVRGIDYLDASARKDERSPLDKAVITTFLAQPKGEFNEKNSFVFFNPSYHFDW